MFSLPPSVVSYIDALGRSSSKEKRKSGMNLGFLKYSFLYLLNKFIWVPLRFLIRWPELIKLQVLSQNCIHGISISWSYIGKQVCVFPQCQNLLNKNKFTWYASFSTSWLVLGDLTANLERFLFLIPVLSTMINSHTTHPTFYSKSA